MCVLHAFDLTTAWLLLEYTYVNIHIHQSLWGRVEPQLLLPEELPYMRSITAAELARVYVAYAGLKRVDAHSRWPQIRRSARILP